MKPILYLSKYNHTHDTGQNHPENQERTKVLEELFVEPPFHNWPQKLSLPATEDQVKRAHDNDYFYGLLHYTPDRELVAIDGDTILSNGSFDAALHAAGTVCCALDDIFSHETKRAFCCVRPPGHHAEPDMAMGFCLLNNVMIGAKHAIETYKVGRIAIIDFDVHHGNGTERIAHFHNKENEDHPIFYASTHAYPLYPMTGDPNDNNDYLCNVQLDEDFGSEAFRKAYIEEVFPALEAYQPDLIMISAGFDAHRKDKISGAYLETEDYRWITKELVSLANKHCSGRICSVLEGGYELSSLKESVRVHLEELAEDEPS
ncbi:MAG: histone deacetylase family protein [Pseudomonadota bacterium]